MTVQRYIDLYGRTPHRRTLMTKMITGDPDSGTKPLTDREISDELSGFLFAATDTTGTTMTFALYRLATLPDVQERLRKELAAADVKSSAYGFQAIQSLPVLNGVVMETLRLYPAAPSALPRVTTETLNIGGIRIPKDVSSDLCRHDIDADRSDHRVHAVSDHAARRRLLPQRQYL